MLKGFSKIIVLLAAMVVLLALAAGCSNLEPGVAAKVYDKNITEDQMKNRAEIVAVKASAYEGVADTSTVDKTKYYPEALHQLVLEEIMRHESDNYGAIVTDSDVQAAYDLILTKNFLGNKDSMLSALNTTEDEMKDQLRNQKIQSQLQQQVTMQVDLTEDDIRAAFDKFVAAYGSPEWRKLGVIVTADEAQAKNVKQLFDAGGQDFSKLVSTYSIDPVTKAKQGTVSFNKTRDDVLPPEVKATAFNTMVGLVTNPIKTDKGYYIVWVQDVEPDNDTSYELVKPIFESSAKDEKMKQAWKDFLDQAEENAHVEYRKDVRPPKK